MSTLTEADQLHCPIVDGSLLCMNDANILINIDTVNAVGFEPSTKKFFVIINGEKAIYPHSFSTAGVDHVKKTLRRDWPKKPGEKKAPGPVPGLKEVKENVEALKAESLRERQESQELQNVLRYQLEAAKEALKTVAMHQNRKRKALSLFEADDVTLVDEEEDTPLVRKAPVVPIFPLKDRPVPIPAHPTRPKNPIV